VQRRRRRPPLPPSLSPSIRGCGSPPLPLSTPLAWVLPTAAGSLPSCYRRAPCAPRSAAAGPVAGGHGRLPGCDLLQPVHVPALSLDSSAPWFAPPFLFLPLPFNSCTIDMGAGSIWPDLMCSSFPPTPLRSAHLDLGRTPFL
jgi:hypothetical protein